MASGTSSRTLAVLLAGALLATVPAARAITPADRAELQLPIEKVFDAPGHSQDEIYASAKIWLAENFRSAKAVTEYDNKEEGTIIGNAIVQYPCKGAFDCLAKGDWKFHFTVRIDTKPDKFRLTFSNIRLGMPATINGALSTPAYEGPLNNQRIRDRAEEALLALGPRLAASIGQVEAKADW